MARNQHRRNRGKQGPSRRHRDSAKPVTLPFEGDRIGVVDSLADQGDGIVRAEDGLYFIDNVLPGEEVRYCVTGKAGSTAWRGQLVDIVSASPERAVPACPHYAECGGCALQHMSDDRYTAYKRSKLERLLAEHGYDPACLTQVYQPQTGTRRRTGLHLRKTNDGTRIGYTGRRSHRLADIQSCIVLHPALQAMLEPLKDLAKRLLKEGENVKCLLTLCDEERIDLLLTDLSCPVSRFTNPDAVQWLGDWGGKHNIGRISLQTGKDIEPVLHLGDLRLSFADCHIDPVPGGFLQASREAETFMTETAMRWLGKFKKAADLFAGAGTFALHMGQVGKVLAVEGEGRALKSLQSVQGKIRHRPEVLERDLFQAPLSFMEMKKLDAILFDPPRAGAEAQAQMIAKGKVATVIAVSCNPVSLLRDMNILRHAGYELDELVGIDQFLWSPHLEAMALMKRI